MIATSYFTAQGWFTLAPSIESLPKIRLLVGCEQPHPHENATYQEISQEHRFREHIRNIFFRHERYLLEEYNNQPFEKNISEQWRKLPQALRKGNFQVRRYKKSFFHAKTWILKNTSASAGSSNLTYAGMQKNQEVNITFHNKSLQQQLEAWYEEVWAEAENYDLASVYDEFFQEYSPYEIYLKTLYECFYDDIGEESDDDTLSLTNFQQHGVARAKRILNKYNGVLIADTVGLGKTFIAGAIMQHYLVQRRQKVMLVVPASLLPTWRNFLKTYDLSDIDPVSYENFARKSETQDFQHEKKRYQLIVIDEAHNYRNPDTKKYAKPLRDFLATEAAPPRDLVLLTATPVNNSTEDLKTLFGYFLQDNKLATHSPPYPSLKAFFKKLKKEENEAINTKRLQPLVDAVTVKRTRHFVQKEYSDAKLPDANGNLQPVTFPTVKLKTVNYSFDEVLPDIFMELEDILLTKNGAPPKLTLALYQVGKYLLEPKLQKDGTYNRTEPNIIGLLRSLILKRFESSLHAFCQTIGAMCKKHQTFLKELEGGNVRRTIYHKAPPSDSDDEEWEKQTSEIEPAENYDQEKLKQDIKNDLSLLQKLAAKTLKPEQDPKLKKLVEELAEIAQQAEHDGGFERQKKDNRKVLVFSYYKDTARWIYDFLNDTLQKNPRLSAYKGKNCLLYTSGSGDGAKSTNPEKAAQRFSPQTSSTSTVLSKISAAEECDILVTTDVLSEGKNLQQCRHIVSYDLPWNPMRLIQRHGRIDRLQSQHKFVFMRTFFPADKLDQFLKLENKVRKKLSLADSATGIEATPIEGGAESDRIYSERREELENLKLGDASSIEAGKTRFDVKTAEEYRQTLRKALEDPKQIWSARLPSMPFKVGSGKFAKTSGHVFCAKVDDYPQAFLRFVPSGVSAEPVADFDYCLELLECVEHAERVLSAQEWKQAFPAWAKAQQSIVEEWNTFVREISVQPPKINREIRDFLCVYPPLGVGVEELSKVINKLKIPWEQHDEKELRKLWKEQKKRLQKKGENTKEIARKVYDFVDKKSMNLHAYSKRYEPIIKDCVRPVCWMSLRVE